MPYKDFENDFFFMSGKGKMAIERAIRDYSIPTLDYEIYHSFSSLLIFINELIYRLKKHNVRVFSQEYLRANYDNVYYLKRLVDVRNEKQKK